MANNLLIKYFLSCKLIIILLLFSVCNNLKESLDESLDSQVVFWYDENLTEVSFTVSSQTKDENSGVVVATMVLNKTAPLNVTIPFIVSGSATLSLDHNLANGSLTIPAGTLSASLSFSIFKDNQVENDETIIITLGKPINAILGSISEQTIYIIAPI